MDIRLGKYGGRISREFGRCRLYSGFGGENRIFLCVWRHSVRCMRSIWKREPTWIRALSAGNGKLREILSRCDEERYAVMKYYVLCDLEACSRQEGDYKSAYECSAARLALAEKMNK